MRLIILFLLVKLISADYNYYINRSSLVPYFYDSKYYKGNLNTAQNFYSQLNAHQNVIPSNNIRKPTEYSGFYLVNRNENHLNNLHNYILNYRAYLNHMHHDLKFLHVKGYNYVKQRSIDDESTEKNENYSLPFYSLNFDDHSYSLPNTNFNDQAPFDVPVPRSKFTDEKKIADKINNDFVANNVLAKPEMNNKNKPFAKNDDNWAPIPFNSGEDADPEIRHRRDVVREMMQHAWSNYVKYAWGENELNPISRTGHSAGIFGNTKLGASIIDGLDTLWIMGLEEEYNRAREYILNELDFDSVGSQISVFEFNIRFVGGLLAAYALTKDNLYMKKAEEIANKLLPAFNTPTGIPYSLINPATGETKNYNWASSSSSILSEFGTMHLEFVYLSHVTGNTIYKDKVVAIRKFLDKIPKKNGLYYNYLNPQSGQWGQAFVSMGALADSFYEYLLKSWLQSDKQDGEARRMYIEAIEAILEKLTRVSPGGLLYFGQLQYGIFYRKMEHLACFSGGMIALGGKTIYKENEASKYISIGANITNTCHESYIRTKTRLGPETFTFSETSDTITSSSNEHYYIQRPETIESYFYLWRITKDKKYRDWAWDATQAILANCRVESGFVGIRNVYSDRPVKDNVQQSFFLAETLKYLYLIFSDDKLISFDKWVFNSEGHPLPIANQNPAYKTDL